MKALALILALAAPAAAQELPFEIGHTEACLASAPDPVAQQACIGTSTGVCMETHTSGYTTAGMISCVGQELDYWDVRLNRSDRTLLARARALELSGAEAPGAISIAGALRDMQRAWIPYRDARCQFEYSKWSGGTAAGPISVDCLMTRTAQHALYLEAQPELE